mgnify:CR=1 FL=1
MDTARQALTDEKPIPLRHPWRWAAATLIALLLVVLIRSVVGNSRFEWPVFAEYVFSEAVIGGVGRTIMLTVAAMIVGILLGVLIAVTRVSPNPLLSGFGWSYINFFRAVPVLVQLIFWYNLAALYPTLSLGVPFGPELYSISANALVTPMTAALLGLGLNEGANMAEIVRGGLLSVDKGQNDAAKALGMTRARTMYRIVLPQALRVIVPPTGNQVIMMLKMTSLVSLISMSDLLYTTQIISARTFQTIPLLMVAAAWYLALTCILSVGQHFLERHFGRSHAA